MDEERAKSAAKRAEQQEAAKKLTVEINEKLEKVKMLSKLTKNKEAEGDAE